MSAPVNLTSGVALRPFTPRCLRLPFRLLPPATPIAAIIGDNRSGKCAPPRVRRRFTTRRPPPRRSRCARSVMNDRRGSGWHQKSEIDPQEQTQRVSSSRIREKWLSIDQSLLFNFESDRAGEEINTYWNASLVSIIM